MKRKTVAILVCTCLVLSACADNKKEVESDQTESYQMSNNLIYYNLEDIIAFAVDGTDVWTIKENENKIIKYNDSVEKVDEIDTETAEYNLMDVYNGKIYLYSMGDKITFKEIDISNKTINEIKMPDDISNPFYMSAMDDGVYFVCWNDNVDMENMDNISVADDGYMDLDEYAIKLDYSTYGTSKIDIDGIVGQAEINSEKIMYYAHDDKGYYFVEYDTKSGTMGEKQYNDSLGYQFCVAVDIDNGQVYAANSKDMRLIGGSINNSGKRDLADNIAILNGNDLIYRDGECYILDSNKNDIARISVESSSKDPVKVYSDNYETDLYSCGYEMSIEHPESDNMEMAILAGDTTYDISEVKTDAAYAEGIKRQGAYYNLQDVDNVEEYLDSCYPYIKEAATTEDGDIWMIPVSIDIPFIMYNEDNCKKAGIEEDFYKDYDSLIKAADKAYEDTSLHGCYSLNAYQLQMYMLEQYNAIYTENKEISYDTEQFKYICELMKNNDPDTKESLHTFVEDYYNQENVFEMAHAWELDQMSDENKANAIIKNMPYVKDKDGNVVEKNYGNCIFLCVNPNSENLKSTLSYISNLCLYMMQQKDNPLNKNSESVLKEIYKNGAVVFEMPSNVFWDCYLSYNRGQMEYSDMVKELERKVNTYLNE